MVPGNLRSSASIRGSISLLRFSPLTNPPSITRSAQEEPIHVISTDTLVENPVVAAWVNRSLDVMGARAEVEGLPFVPHRLTPRTEDSFWVNLTGKGYRALRKC